jgi:(p)ppGpp synthase/HD superfamily hydrolase
LHTVIRLPCGHTLEIQIRTARHHRVAETGPAAHWRYKRRSGLPEGNPGR